jgi:hypothetical protein
VLDPCAESVFRSHSIETAAIARRRAGDRLNYFVSARWSGV